MLNDEYFFDHENNHHHDHVQKYKQEQYHQTSRIDLIHLCNSIKDQDDHMHWDEWEHDLEKKKKK
jgi:hypothetical protein